MPDWCRSQNDNSHERHLNRRAERRVIEDRDVQPDGFSRERLDHQTRRAGPQLVGRRRRVHPPSRGNRRLSRRRLRCGAFACRSPNRPTFRQKHSGSQPQRRPPDASTRPWPASRQLRCPRTKVAYRCTGTEKPRTTMTSLDVFRSPGAASQCRLVRRGSYGDGSAQRRFRWWVDEGLKIGYLLARSKKECIGS
jgi:hypothetical protein